LSAGSAEPVVHLHPLREIDASVLRRSAASSGPGSRRHRSVSGGQCGRVARRNRHTAWRCDHEAM